MTQEQEQKVKTEEEVIAEKVQNALGVRKAYVDIEEYYFDDRDFFETNDTIWDAIKEEGRWEDLEFPWDEIIEDAINPDDVISEDAVDEVKELVEEMQGLDEQAVSEVKAGQKYSSWFKMEEMVEIVKDDKSENICKDLIGFSNMDELRQDAEESLAYWIKYFKPNIEDVEVALKCGLTPFYFDGEFYLALGGCGMDLSPKLDAYQMLTSHRIPRDSRCLRSDRSYFEYVAGKDTTKEALDKCKRDVRHVKISYDMEK